MQKKLTLALLALSMTTPAFADDCCLRIPSQQGGFKIGFDALYLRPNNNNLDYGIVVATLSASPAARTTSQNVAVDPSYDWGFYVQAGYLFPCTGNDLTLGYTYIRSEETDGVNVGNVTNIAVASFPLSPLFGTFQAATAKAKIDLNAVDIEGGQRFTTGAYDMRMFAGLRYANIDYKLASHAVDFPGATPFAQISQQFKSQYRGIGPRLGVDGRYCLRSGFGVDANLSTTLLAGRVDSSYNGVATTTAAGAITNAFYDVKNGSRNRIVPVLEAKLGVDYTHIIDCRCKSSIVFEAGYQVTNYFNAVDHPGVDFPINGLPALELVGTTTDVSFDGPYLGVKYYA